jgi:hypothetical protein
MNMEKPLAGPLHHGPCSRFCAYQPCAGRWWRAQKGCVMGASELLRQRAMVNARRLIAKLSTFNFVFTLSSFGYCAIHWLLTHSFSTYVFSGALVFGAMAAMAVAWLLNSHRGPSEAEGVNTRPR